jgi:hypothetical protein
VGDGVGVVVDGTRVGVKVGVGVELEVRRGVEVQIGDNRTVLD